MRHGPPQNTFREKKKRRIATEAKKREIERAEAHWAFLQEESRQADNQRQREEGRRAVDQQNTLTQIGIAKAQLETSRNANCITVVYSALTLLSVFGVFIGVLITYRSMLIDQRAWVSPLEVTAEAGSESSFLTFMKVTYKNTGKTPALGTDSFIGTTPFLDRVPPMDKRGKDPYAGLMASNGVFNTSSIDNPFSPDALKLIKSGRARLYVYGTIW
jgi:hypothetical protein